MQAFRRLARVNRHSANRSVAELDAIHGGIDGRIKNLEMAAGVYERRLKRDLDRAARRCRRCGVRCVSRADANGMHGCGIQY